MNPDDLFPMVTAIVKYDLFPYYAVAKGKLTRDGGIKLDATRYYGPGAVIRILPEDQYVVQNMRRTAIQEEYRKKERQLRIDILEGNNVDFVTVK